MTVRVAPKGDVASGGVQRTTVAEDRVQVLFVRLVAVGYCFYGVLTLTSVYEGWTRFSAWWTPLAVVLVFGTGIAMGAMTFGANAKASRIRVAAVVAAAGYMTAAMTAPFAWHGPIYMEAGADTWWPSTLLGLPVIALAATMPPAVPVAYLIALASLVQSIRAVNTLDSVISPIYVEVAFNVMFNLAFVAITVAARRTGRIIDEATYHSHRAAAVAAASAARDVERERFDALIHDGVMGTLLAAFRLGAAPEVVVHACDTLGQLDRLADGESEPDEYVAEGAVAVIRNAVSAADQRATVTVVGESVPIRGEVARAVAAATAEAVRNAERHAGVHVVCRVSICLSDGGLDVVVADDGCGFDPQKVSQLRLGLAVSIRGRMRQLDGGRAEILSSPGRGTTVKIGWRRS